MCKKILSWLLVCLLLSAVLPVCAAEQELSATHTVSIVNVKNLEKLARNCRLDSYSENLVVSLRADLDLTGSDFEGIPVFCGRFEGNGHTIQGLNLTQEGSVQGFFRYLTESAVVNDLHLKGAVQPTGSGGTVGAFVGENRGTLRGCSFAGTVSGRDYIGGIAGVNTVTGTIENCHVDGSVYGGHFIGGIAGQNAGTIRFCENHSSINETSRQNQVELSDITLDSVFRSESVNTVTDVGGIAGNNTGIIRDCSNYAVVGHSSMGYNIGGIAGTQSGTVLNCENHGDIHGRKEVGGIVGQMEPSSVIEFEEDALQILGRQLDGLGNAVSKASSNLQGVGETIAGQMGEMFGYIGNAQDAIKSLIPDVTDPMPPDMDTIHAAMNNIGSSISGMTHLMDGVGATAYNAIGKVSSNLHEINDQINAMRTTIGNISETTGGSIIDRSDEDTEFDFTGKVAQCKNFGAVQGDLNCGGITGAIALENDMDMEEDLLIRGENSLNFESELRAVILDCENSGVITAGKQHAGGIAGFQSLGLVKMSRNTGKLDAKNADYVGGISGRSMGFIRNSYANGEILGAKYVGGIAGSAAVVTDCSVLVRLSSGIEKVGAVLGSREENLGKVEDPIAANFYLSMQEDPGGIDGISYDGQAQPMQEEAFFLQEDLPQMFKNVTVTFRYGNGTERKFTVDFGGTFLEEWIPPIPPKEGRESYWKGLEEADLSGIFFDLFFEQAYTNQITTLESSLMRNAVPLLFVQGIFTENAVVHVQQDETQPPLERGEKLLEVWQFRSSEPANQTQIRLQLPETADTQKVRILIRGEDDFWREESFHVLGRYVVAALTPGDDAIAVIRTETMPWLLILLFAGLAVAAGVWIIRQRQRRKT